MSYTTTATNTYSGNNTVVVTTVANMLSGLPIVFTGNVFGNVTANATYYIGNITGSNQITLSSLPGGAVYALANGSGFMYATFSTGGQQIIDVVPPGDPLDVAFEKTNVNFDQIFASGPVGSNIQIANNTIRTTNTNGNLILAPNGIGNVVSNVNIVPNTANLRNLGSPTQRWATIYTQYIDYTAGNISFSNFSVSGNISAGGYISAAGNVTGNYILGNGSLLTGISVSTNKIFNGNSYANIATANGNVVISANGAIWSFNTNGTTAFPAFTFPNIDGANGQVLVTNGNGVVAWGNGQYSVITNQTINGTGSANTFSLAQSATSDSVFVTINGISQTPAVDYTVLGNVITFTTTPIVGDVAQVRFLAGNVLNVSYSNANVAAFLPTYSGQISNLNIQGQSITGVVANGNILLEANGTGEIIFQNNSNSIVTIDSTASNVTNTLRVKTTGTNIGNTGQFGGGVIAGSYILGNGTPTQSQNRLAAFVGLGSEDGTTLASPAKVRIEMDAADNWSNGNTPAHISFWTTASGTNVASETARFAASGNLNIYTGSINAANGNVSASYFIGNGSLLTGITGSGGTGNTGNITFNNTTITSNVANANVTLQGNGTGNVNLGSSVSVAGNITANYLYGNGYYLTGLLTTITNQTLTGDNVETNFTLNQTATANSVLVTVNGISQTPDVDYTVSGNVITFTSAPYTGDTMQVRFLANNFSSGGGGGNGDTGNITFNNTTISSNVTNANINLQANGTGTVVITGAGNTRLVVQSTASNVQNSIAINTIGTTLGNLGGGIFNGSYILGNGTPTQINNRLSTIIGSGSENGTTILTPSPVKITLDASANWTTGNTPTHISFWTTGFGTNVSYETARFDSLGNLIIYNGGVLANGRISASGNVIANNFNTSGNVSASGNVIANNFVGNIVAAPGNTSIQINVDGVLGAAANFSYDYGANVLYAPSAAFSGQSGNGTTGLFVGLPAYTFLGSNLTTQITSNVNSYAQVNQQNISSGNLAQTDYVATADNGSDSTFYIDMGITSSTYANPYFFGDTNTFNDGYLFVAGNNQLGPGSSGVANLLIGSSNGNIKMWIGNAAQANVIQTISSTGVFVNGNVTADFFVGNLILPAVNDTQQQVQGTQQTILGDPFPTSAVGNVSVTVWTADSAAVSAAKMTMRAQYGNTGTPILNIEIMDIMMAKTYPDGVPVFTVSNRVKTNPAYADTLVDVTLAAGNVMQVTSSGPDAVGIVYWTYSVTAFNQT